MASGGTYSFIAGRVLNLQAGSKTVGLLCDPPSAPQSAKRAEKLPGPLPRAPGQKRNQPARLTGGPQTLVLGQCLDRGKGRQRRKLDGVVNVQLLGEHEIASTVFGQGSGFKHALMLQPLELTPTRTLRAARLHTMHPLASAPPGARRPAQVLVSQVPASSSAAMQPAIRICELQPAFALSPPAPAHLQCIRAIHGGSSSSCRTCPGDFRRG